MSECCKEQGALCCAGEPTEVEVLAARIAELEEALELLWDYCGRSLQDERRTFPAPEFMRKWGELDEVEIDQRIQNTIDYEVI